MKKILLTLVLFIPQLLFSDIVILRNGKKIEGKITNQTRTKVEIITEKKERLILDKAEILKIQFGSGEEEIKKEELRRQEEERKRLEELRKREDEERRRIEEEKRRQEEENRKKEEEARRQEELKRKQKTKIPKEPLIKQNQLILGYGYGPSYTIPLFIKIYNVIFHALEKSGPLIVGSNKQISQTTDIKWNSSSETSQIFLHYLKNDWEWGISIKSFMIREKNFKLQSYSWDPQFISLIVYQDFRDSNNKTILPKHDIIELYGKYSLYKTIAGNHPVILGLKVNLFSIDSKIKNHNIRFFSPYFFKNYTITFNNLNNTFLFIGPHIFYPIDNKQSLEGEILIANTNFESRFITRFFESRTFQGISQLLLDANLKGETKDIYLSFKYNYNIYKDIFIFLQYLYNENQYYFTNIYSIQFSSGINTADEIPLFFPNVIWQIFFTGQKKVAIEKNQYINIGIMYHWNFL